MNNDEHQQFNLPDEDPNAKPEQYGQSANVERIDKTLSVKDFYIFNDNEAINRKGQKFNRLGVSGSNYTVTSQDFLIGITSLILAPSIGLPRPSLAGNGKNYIVKDEVGGAATTTITVRSEGEATIDGASSSTITTNYGSKEYYTNGVSWFTK